MNKDDEEFVKRAREIYTALIRAKEGVYKLDHDEAFELVKGRLKRDSGIE